MKILLVDTSLKMGGAEVLVSNMMELLRNRGHEVELAIFNGEKTALYEKLEKQNFHIHLVGPNYTNVYDIRRIPKLRKLIRNFDVVHTNTSPAQVMTALASIGLSVPLVTTEHSTNNRRRRKKIIKPLDKFVYSKYKTIVGCSEDASQSLKKYIPDFSDRIITIKNGVNIRKFESADPIVLSSNVHSDQINVIMVGRFQHPKDQITVVKALKYLPVNIHVYFVGDGENRKPTEDTAEEIGVASRTHFLGIRNDIPNLLKGADIAVHSSYWEGLPLSILEEMAAGCPVIASNAQGISSIVEGAGLLFKPGDAKDLAEKILILVNDINTFEDTRGKCRTRASEFDIDNMIEKYLYYYSN